MCQVGLKNISEVNNEHTRLTIIHDSKLFVTEIGQINSKNS